MDSFSHRAFPQLLELGDECRMGLDKMEALSRAVMSVKRYFSVARCARLRDTKVNISAM